MGISSIRGARDGRAVDLADARVVDVTVLADDPLGPWLVRPRGEVDLPGWAEAGAGEVERLLLERGAVLFRDFGLRSAADFERSVQALTSDLYGGYGDLPREGASRNVYKSTPYPADETILFHSESSHLPTWPTRIGFFCLIPAADRGQTPIADTREIARRLDPEVLAEFEAKGLLYLRNFSGLDVSWQQFFQTEDRAEVESRCAEGGASLEWSDDGERLRVRQPAAAVRPHPVTGERLFFNQIQLHHPYYLPAATRESLRSVVGGPDEFPRSVTFGDGTPISDDIAAHVLGVYWDTCVMFPWQQGDLLLLDNMRIAHARMPYSGPRRIAVAMARMTGAASA